MSVKTSRILMAKAAVLEAYPELGYYKGKGKKLWPNETACAMAAQLLKRRDWGQLTVQELGKYAARDATLTAELDHRRRTIRGVDVHALSEQCGGQKPGTGTEFGHANAPTERCEGGQGLGETLLRRGVRAIAVGSFVEAHGLRGRGTRAGRARVLRQYGSRRQLGKRPRRPGGRPDRPHRLPSRG